MVQRHGRIFFAAGEGPRGVCPHYLVPVYTGMSCRSTARDYRDDHRMRFERDKEDFKAQKVKEMAELSGLREKFESNSERIKHGAEKAFMKLYDVFMESTDSKEEPIGAVVVEEPATPEEKAIEAIGEEILEALDAGKINMNTIEQISAAVKQILNNL